MKLEELRIYQLAMEMGEIIWVQVQKWDYFSKDTIGKQLVRAVDSVAANLSVPINRDGRYHFKETKQFGYYSGGSLYETKTWLTKAHNRELLNDKNFEALMKEINSLGKQLNKYIKSIGEMTNDQLLMTNK
ncbi:MAG TPA: four helix bundle protein [Candidatus Marinimicrobia bacterium]|nr:four helix bundle protein [Candidatus Neomarinimicrobiota bacterium]